MLSRQPYHARFEIPIRGLTKEEAFTDYFARRSGSLIDENDDQSFRLDRAMFSLVRSDSADLDPTEDTEILDNLEFLCLGSEQVFIPSADLSALKQEETGSRQVDALAKAMQSLTDLQATALWLWARGLTERDASDFLCISQPTYHEIIHGKNGIGGAIRKLFKYFQKHPITSL
ncbi:hypothetical protein EHM69_10520 [candidate division KSB1 bacterium]|nr:MAG: hypothetical protein EHM69_10520 [candidate division KSB1 bacterium]